LQEAGIPIPPLWLTPQGEPLVTLDEDAFELQQWVDGAIYNSADPRNLKWVSSAGAMLARLHQASHGYAGSVYRWPPEAQAGGLVQGWLNFASVATSNRPSIYTRPPMALVRDYATVEGGRGKPDCGRFE